MRASGLVLAGTALLAPIALVPRSPGPEVLRVVAGEHLATGFASGPDRVVTVAHVLDGGGALRVRAPGMPPRRARVVRLDARDDLALLAVPGLRARPLRLGAASVGRVLRRPARVLRAIVAEVDGGPARPALELVAHVEPGDSGAPFVGPGGRVAGVVFARSTARPGRAYAVDASVLPRLLSCGSGSPGSRRPGSGRASGS